MMSVDGGLRYQLQSHIKDFHWQSVETWGTGRGVPDVNYCFGGVEGWIELKAMDKGRKVPLRPEQIAWINRRIRAGGRVFILIKTPDFLLLYPGTQAVGISEVGGLKNVAPIFTTSSKKPEWGRIRDILLS